MLSSLRLQVSAPRGEKELLCQSRKLETVNRNPKSPEAEAEKQQLALAVMGYSLFSGRKLYCFKR